MSARSTSLAMEQNPVYSATECITPKRVVGGRKISGRFTRCEHDRLVSIDVMEGGIYRRRRQCSHSPVRAVTKRSPSQTPAGVTRAATRSTSMSVQHPRTAQSKAKAKAKAAQKKAMDSIRAKKAALAARSTNIGAKSSSNQKTKRNARFETPKKASSQGNVARSTKTQDFHKQHESNYFDDRAWKADLASDDEELDNVAFAVNGPRAHELSPAMEFAVPTHPPKKRITSITNSTPSKEPQQKRRRRTDQDGGSWSLRRDGEVFSDDEDYDEDVEREDYPKRMRRRVGRDKSAGVWATSRKRRRGGSRKKQSALVEAAEGDFEEEELEHALHPSGKADPNMVYFAGLTRSPTLAYKYQSIAVPKKLVYDEFVEIPGSLDSVENPLTIGTPIFGVDYMPGDNRLEQLEADTPSKARGRGKTATPSARALALCEPLNLGEIFAKQSEETSSTAAPLDRKAQVLKRFAKFFGDDEDDDAMVNGEDAPTWFDSMKLWVSSWVTPAPAALTPVSSAA